MWGGKKGYTHPHMHAHMSSSKTGEMQTKSVCCFTLNFLAVILCCHFATCFYRGKQGGEYPDSFYMASYNCMWPHNYLKKSLMYKKIFTVYLTKKREIFGRWKLKRVKIGRC